MLVVKLGGSYITYKRIDSSVVPQFDERRRSYAVKRHIVEGCARALKGMPPGGLLIVHGGGTHGHRTVVRWKEGMARGGERMMPWEVRWRMDQLTAEIITSLGRGGIPAFPISPADIVLSSEGRIRTIDPTPILRALDRGMIPVLRGDIIPDVDGGWSVVSGDTIITRLVELSKAAQTPPIERVLMLMESDAFYSNGLKDLSSRVPSIDPVSFHDHYTEWSSSSQVTGHDVSGGMMKKLRSAHQIASFGVRVDVIGGEPSVIGRVLSGGDIGTRFDPFDGDDRCRSLRCVREGVRC